MTDAPPEAVGEVAVSATGLLRAFSAAGALGWADVHPAQHLGHLFGEKDERVLLALALTVRALRSGSICLALDRAAEQGFGDETAAVIPAAWWPEPTGWLAALQASPAVAAGEQDADRPRPLRLVDGLLYLDRHWQDQENVRRLLTARLADAAPPAADARAADPRGRAVALALSSPLTVIAGGPGTGKTTIIRRVIAELASRGANEQVGLAAPTGKAAARMTKELVNTDLTATTLHALLGWRPGSRSRFVHDASNPLPHDVVIVDEVSMVSMLLMSRLLTALKPAARLVLVGDPDQLASVDAGSVLADMTQAPAIRAVMAELTFNYRFSGDIRDLADAIRSGDPDRALAALEKPDSRTVLVPPDRAEEVLRPRCVASGRDLFEAAADRRVGDALGALDRHRLLCGHRRGPYGVQHWGRLVPRWLADDVAGFTTSGEFYPGRPVMMTANAADFELHNGDTGVIVVSDGVPVAHFRTGSGDRAYSPYLLDGLQSVHASTVHKAQGSQFRHVSVVLPPPGSPLLTRELLYTAVTRAEDSVVLVGTADAVRQAVANPARRTSGLTARLAAPPPATSG